MVLAAHGPEGVLREHPESLHRRREASAQVVSGDTAIVAGRHREAWVAGSLAVAGLQQPQSVCAQVDQLDAEVGLTAVVIVVKLTLPALTTA